MQKHEAVFRFTTPHADRIYRALQPELSDEVNPRSVTCCRLDGPSTLVLEVTADDEPALRAALNMVLRLINVADEVQGLVEKEPGGTCGFRDPDRPPRPVPE